MKIEFRAASAGDYVVLADEGVVPLAARISGFQPKRTASPQIEPGFGSPGVAVFDNGNDQWTISFSIERIHTTPDAALLFIAQHSDTFGNLGNLDLKITVGDQVLYFVGCAMTEFTPDPHSDRSTKCHYSFVGGRYSSIEP